MKRKLLITAAGTGTGYSYALAKSRWFNELGLITADINQAELVSASVFSEEHVILPNIKDASYFDRLSNILKELGVDVYIPLIDQEVFLASQYAEILGVHVACNNSDFCEAALYKSRYSNWLDVPGVMSPPLLDFESLVQGQLVIVKEDGGFGSRSTKVLLDKLTVADYLEQGWHAYEYIEGAEFTVDCFPVNGEVVTSVRQRIEVKLGVCTKAKILRNTLLEGLARYLVFHFDLDSPFCFQARERNGVYYLIDLNPRLGAGSSMSALNGTDFFAAHLAVVMGKDPLPFLRPRFKECVVTRQYMDYLMSGSK